MVVLLRWKGRRMTREEMKEARSGNKNGSVRVVSHGHEFNEKVCLKLGSLGKGDEH